MDLFRASARHREVPPKSVTQVIDFEARWKSHFHLACSDESRMDSFRASLSELKDRGLYGMELIVSDAHEGLQAAHRTVFPSVSWPRCPFHVQHNAGP